MYWLSVGNMPHKFSFHANDFLYVLLLLLLCMAFVDNAIATLYAHILRFHLYNFRFKCYVSHITCMRRCCVFFLNGHIIIIY